MEGGIATFPLMVKPTYKLFDAASGTTSLLSPPRVYFEGTDVEVCLNPNEMCSGSEEGSYLRLIGPGSLRPTRQKSCSRKTSSQLVRFCSSA